MKRALHTLLGIAGLSLAVSTAHAQLFEGEVTISDTDIRYGTPSDENIMLSIYAVDSLFGHEYLVHEEIFSNPEDDFFGSQQLIDSGAGFNNFTSELTDGSVDLLVFEVKAPFFDKHDLLEPTYTEFAIRTESSMYDLFGATDFAGMTIQSILVSVDAIDIEYSDWYFGKHKIESEVTIGMDILTANSGGPQGAVPEPSVYGLAGAGVLALLIARRHRAARRA